MSARRLAVIAGAAMALLAVSAAVFIAIRHTRRAGQGSAVTESGEPTGHLRLELGLPGGQPLAVGTPVFLNVSLAPTRGTQEGAPATVGEPGRPWWDGLRLECDSAGQRDLLILVAPLAPEPVLRLGAGDAGYARVAVAPEGGLVAGANRIEAVWQQGAVEARSNAVMLELARRTSPVPAAIARARYELWRGEPAAALAAANEGLAVSASAAELHSLKGRSLEAMGRLEEAREAAARALALTRGREKTPLSEPPVIYIRDLDRIEDKLKRQEEGEPR